MRKTLGKLPSEFIMIFLSLQRQYTRNKGRCGICGDPWDEKQPRKNEAGGKYGKGIITEHYSEGQVSTIQKRNNYLIN